MAQINDVEKLYNALKRDGYDDLGTLDEFSSRVKDRDNARKLYDSMQSEGYDDLGTADEFYSRLNPVSQGYTPTPDEMAGFQQTIGQAQQTVAGAQQAANRIRNRQQRAGLNTPKQPIRVGQNSKVTKSDEHYNLATGQMEATYTTEQGNEYQSRELADIEQNAVDIANRQMSLPGQLEDAYAERDRLEEALRQRVALLDQEYDSRPWYVKLLREMGNAARSDKMPEATADTPDNRGYDTDEEYQTLMAAWRKNREAITTLEAERDDHGQTQFWRGFADAAKNPSTLSFGMTDFADMGQLMRIKLKVDAANEAGEDVELTDAEQALLRNTMNSGYAQQMFGENRGFMYRAGGISMQALPFVAEFVGTGGFSSITHAGASLGTRAAEKLALEGMKKTMMKNLGVVMGDVVAGFAMANTTGAARTGADIMERNIGHVTMGEDGQYQFEEGKSLGRSIYEGEVASMLEYYTEKLGEHLQLGQWIGKGLNKMGLSKLSKAVNYMSKNPWLEKGGIQDYPSEVVEEQANLLLNAILVGDQNLSTEPLQQMSNEVFGTSFHVEPNSEEYKKSVFNPKTQLDIWGGMMFSIGLMQTPRLAHTGYNAAGYYAYKHATNTADASAAAVFGDDNWQMIKEQIDNCDNESMSDLLASVVEGGMSDEQKQATMNYAANLLKMRGFNNGLMADVRGGEDFESSEEAFISHGIDQGYQQGHETQEPDEKVRIMNEAREAEARLSELFDPSTVDWISNMEAPMDAFNIMLANRGDGSNGTWNDDEIAAVVDYYQKQARAQGVLDAAADDVDYQVAKANAEVNSNTHNGTGLLIEVTSGDDAYFVVGGDVQIMPSVETEGAEADNAAIAAFDMQGTGDALIVRNVQTGEISVMSPQRMKIVGVSSAEASIQENETTLRQQLMQQHDDEITFGSPANEVFNMNDTVVLSDGQGGVIEGEIGMLPAAVDAPYVIYTSDGRALQLTADQLNMMVLQHNGMQVERAISQPVVGSAVETAGTDAARTVEPGTEPAGGEADIVDDAGANEPPAAPAPEEAPQEPDQPQSALDRIPYLQDEQGQPVLNKKGKKQYQWHKASVDDTADALIETTGGDMVLARDTATQMTNISREKLEKIRKQKPKGDDPIEIAESRAAINKQVQEHQAVIKHWQDVNQTIQRRMQAESVRKEEERRAALSEEQRRQEDERKRQEKERQDQIAAERRRQQIEEDLKNWNKPYQPLKQAKREMAGDANALSYLENIEPQSLEEWVSSLLRPQSIQWADTEVDGRTVTGLQSELGLNWNDMQRFGGLIGGKGKGKPFGQVVHEIWEDLPEGMKNMYTDQDVRNALLELFNETDSKRMRNLTAEHRIEQAREVYQENQRREAEYEMEAWADFYHLTPEERETFEEFMQQPPTEPEQDIIDQIIADYEQSRTSPSMGEQPDSGTVPAGFEGSEGEVQGEGEAAGDGHHAEGTPEGAETSAGQPPVAGDTVSGGTRSVVPAGKTSGHSVERSEIAELFRQVGADVSLAELMSDYEVNALSDLVDEWDQVNSEYGEVIEQQRDALKSKNKAERDAAQQIIDEAQERANEAFEPVEQYVAALTAKYVTAESEQFTGVIPNPEIDEPRYRAIRQDLVDAYRSGDTAAITAAAQAIQQYVDEGLDAPDDHTEIFDIAEEYDGNDPELLADQYIIRVFWDRYLDDDADQEYIKTGMKARMREQQARTSQEDPIAAAVIAARNGDKEAQDRLNKFGIKWEKKPVVRFVAQGEVEHILNGGRYEGRFGNGRVDVTNSSDITTAATADYRITFKDELDWTLNDRLRMKNEELGDGYIMDGYSLDDVATIEKRNEDGSYTKVYDAETPVAPSEQLRPTDQRDAVRPQSAELGVNAANARAREATGIAEDEAASVISAMKSHASVAPFVEITDESWHDNVETPLGKVKMGENQKEKLFTKGRELQYGMLLETLGNPDLVLEERDKEPTMFHERPSSYLFVKTFQKPDGSKYVHFESVTVSQEGMEVSISSHIIRENQLKNKLKSDRLLYKATALDEPANSSAEQPTSEGSGLSSGYKGTKNSSNNQGFRQESAPIGATSSPEQIAEQEGQVDTNPSEAQKEAGNYQKGHIKVDGYDITIENPKGSVRSGVDADGNRWETKMHNNYGYIRGTEGVDGDHIDVFLSDNPASGNVYVIDQTDGHGNFDEHKVMYGFASEEEAREAYLSNYDEGWQGLGNITEVSRADFKKWVESSHRKTKPFAEYKAVKKATAAPLRTNQQPGNPAVDTAGTVAAKEQPKRLVSDDRMEELKKRLKQKLGGQLNVGVDPEVLAIGAEMAVGYIERGVTKFADYARTMIEEVGDFMRPYLKSFFNAVRDMPEAQEYAGQMDDYQTVSSFDVFNFDKGGKAPTVIEKAEQVTKEQKVRKQAKKIKQEQPDLFGDLFAAAEPVPETKPAKAETKTPVQETKPAKAETQPQRKEVKLRPATEADLDGQHPIVYYQRHPYNIVAVMHSGEQVSATQFSKPRVERVILTNGKDVKLEQLQVEDTSAGTPVKKGKTAWWNDPNRPQNLDPSDYRTYTTDEAKAYFAQFVAPADEKGKVFPDFTKWTHPNLAYITAAAWDGAVIPLEELMELAEVKEAEERLGKALSLGTLEISPEELEQHAQHLLDAEHGSQVYKDGKKVKDDYSGPVRQDKKALIVIGRPAGGKSSVFADRLSYENGARIIDSDVVKPWLEGFDEGYGAGRVHNASAAVADRAMQIALANGDNMVIPRIGGPSVIRDLVIPLREKGYKVSLYYNEVSEQSSIMRAASRFAQEGRYLSLHYLTTLKGKDYKTFINFAEKNLGDYYDEQEANAQRPSDGSQSVTSSVLADGRSVGRGTQAARSGEGGGVSPVVQTGGQLQLGRQRQSGNGELADGERIFSYAEWKSNDVAFGEKPKEIWNSESGKPLPGGTKVKAKSNEGEQKVSGQPETGSQGARQRGQSVDRPRTDGSSEPNRSERSGSGHSVGNTLGVVGGAVQTRSGSTSPATRANGNARKAASPISNNNRRNNVGERGKDYAPLSPKARFNANVEAIRLMRQLVDDGVEAPTKEQMAVLRQYSGWGGMGTFFNDETSAENKLLHDLLSEEEYHDAALSIKSAYYTPATVIDTLWDVAKALGFKGGNVLEGSAGIGNIIGQMPKEMSKQSDIEAVEIDPITGNILKLLYPDAKVHIQGFQDTVIPNGSVDLAITNVPFVTGMHVIDKVDKDLSRRFENIHDFCIAKNIRKLREGGLGIFISSNGTLDKSTKLREWITDEGQADVIGAFRLHNKTFGGAPVTSDIIVVRKRVNGQKSAMTIDISKASPMRVGTYVDKDGNEKQVTMTVNDYFHEHPEMMAGEMAFGYEKGAYRPGSYGLYPVEGKEQKKMLVGFVKRMKEVEAAIRSQQTEQPAGEAVGTVAEQNQLTAEKEGRMLVDEKGRLCVSERGEAVPLGLNATKVKGYSKAQCFEDYQAVQKAVDDVLQQQLNDPDDAALQPKLVVLNKVFDTFVKRYGNLHKNTAIAFLRNDIDFPSFLALENYSESKDINGKVTVSTSKTPLFRQRVLGFKTEPQPKTVKDAVIASIFRSNSIDVPWIVEKMNETAALPQYTEQSVRDAILESRLGFENPSTGQLEVRYKYLSGNVREKLAIAEGYNKDGKYSANVEELRKVVPMDIPAHLIEFSLGSSWIPLDLYKQYLAEVYDLNNVKLAHMEGAWMLDPQSGLRNEKNRAAGVYSEQFKATIYGHELVAAALNNRPVKVAKQVTEGYGSSKTTRTIVDQAATQACAVRVDEIKDEFKQWAKKKMQEDPELASTIEKLYNDKFNALVPMHIDDELLPEHFENSNVNITLYGHQKRGVMRGVTAPTMLAHEVGTGKSFTLITTAMEMRRLGTARKPMIVVQNATVAQLTSDAKLLYPNAKILSLSEKDRSAEGRRSFYAKIKYNDWDIIIVPQSTFERIPDSPERELQFIQEKIDEKKHVIEAAAQAGVDERELKRLQKELDDLEQEYGDKYLDDYTPSVEKKKKKNAKDEAAAIEKAKTKAKEQLDRAVDDVQYFDDLGVDALLVDEAHEYKHLGFQTSIGRGIKGIDPSYSKKCAGLYNKTRSVFEKAGWKNVVFATGTPISNTAAEIWTFMKYLMPADVMRQNDIYYFDDFVHNFGNISQMLEFATSGKFKENTRFAAYVNKPELIRIWSQVADTVLTKEVGAVNEKIPEMEGGKDQDVFLPQSPSLINIMAAVRAELERFEKMSGKEKRENSSIPLTMYGIAKRAAIDPRLVNPDAPDEPLSKTNAAVKEIVKDLETTKDYKGTVAVFCDNQNRLGTGKDGKKSVEFNIYDDMRDKLIALGVPAEQIAIIKSGMSITAKQKIFDAVNAGDIRVVLGSTQTLGTGVNMQERLHLLIHMDAPDRPMDYTQRNGRIKRQGNLHKTWGKTIRVIRFGVEDSLDVTAYQRLKTKSGFIDSIMDGKGALLNNQVDRTVEEEEEGLFDNPVAVLSGSQYALKKNQAERELRKYQGKKAQWEADQVYVTSQLRRNKSYISGAEEDIKREQANMEHIKSLFPDGKVKVITIEGTKVDMTKADAQKQLAAVMKEQVNDSINATVKQLRENEIYNDQIIPIKIELDGHAVNFEVSVEREAVWDNGKMRTVIHKYTTFKSGDLREESHMKGSKGVKDILEIMLDQIVTGRDYQDRIDAIQMRIERTRQESGQLEKRVGVPFQFDKELAEAKQHVEEYTELMKKEMEEKEAKYAVRQSAGDAASTFDLQKAEDSEEDDGNLYSADEDILPDHVIRVLDALEGEYPGFNDAFSVEPGLETGQAELWVSNREAAMQLYKSEHPDAQGDYYFSAYMWARSLFEDKLRDPSLQTAADELPDFAADAEQQRSRIIGTDNFKGFFGDFQNDPENASKAVDANGEPLILYHATNLTQVNKGKPFWTFYPGSHFGTVGQSKSIIRDDDGRTKTYPVYLNIRNPKRVSDVPDSWLDTHSEWWEQQIRRAKEEGYDGIVYLNRYEDKEHPADSWIAFYPEQVKSAQENVGTYDPTNPDIRYRDAERFREGQTFPIRRTDLQSSYDVLGRSSTYSTELMPDEYVTEQALLDALRNQYPEYYVSIEDGSVRMESWRHVMRTAAVPQSTRLSKGARNYVERKMRNAVNAVMDLAGRMGLDVEVLTTTEGLEGKNARAKGFFNRKTGKITLVLPNNASQSDLIKTLLHEGVAHFGLRKLFGSHFTTFLDNVYNNVSPEIRRRIDAAMKRNGWSRHTATEEYLARLAERTDFEHAASQGWWQKIKAFFIRMLVEAGFSTSLTDNELRYVLWRSYDNLLHPDRRRTIFDAAKEVDMRRKLGISRYSRERERLQRTGRVDTSRIVADGDRVDEEGELYSLRTKEPPKKTGTGYKVFVLKNGQLYPPMVANPGGEGTPVGVWLDADAAPIAGTSKTGRPQVKSGGKGTQGGSGQLAYRPGWHLGTIPYALQFNRKDENGERTLFPNNFIWAEVEYADDVDYQDEARQQGINANGKYQHSLAGLKHLPVDGSYKYRTNPDPRTDEWVITGAMRVTKILSRDEVNDLVRKAGREPQPMQDGDVLTQEALDELNAEIKSTMEADEMGLLYRADDDWGDDVAQEMYEKSMAKESLKWQEAWQDSMISLKEIQNAIAAETGRVATGAEDAYRFENRMHGRAKNMTEQYNWRYYRPMLKAFNDFCKSRGLHQWQGIDYLIAKSGLERNVYYALRDGAKAKIADEVKQEREQLEKDYAKRRITEADYAAKKEELAERERTGVDDFMDSVRSMFAYRHAKDEYDKGSISYSEYIRIIEQVIRSQLKRAKPKKDADGNVVSDNYYDDYEKDYSGLTETFAKELYDAAQKVKRKAQRAIDKKERRELWREYDEQMRQAYITARQYAEDAVFGAEGGTAALPQSTELWKAINAATKETLRQSFESGLIDKKNYNKVRAMFNWYIPLRGWEEDKASDVYTYMGRDNVFSPAVKKTWGRRSQAEHPLAYIGNIAVSTILSGHRNQMKQHFLNYVMNNPTSLVSISESWYENISDDDDAPVWILRTADTAGKSADEIAQIVSDFNDEMQQKQKEGKAMPVRGRLRLDVNATQGQKAEHVVEVQRAGRTYQLYINGNPKAAQALNGTAAKAVSRISDTWLGKKITSLNRSMAAFFTSKNPAFVISNLSRDLNMAGASVAINEGVEYNARFIANVGKVLRPRMGKSSKWVPASKQPTGMMPSLMRKWRTNTLDESNETERLFKEFMNEGGETGFVNMLSVDSFKEKMKKEIAQMNGSAMFGKGVKETTVHKGFRLLGDTFEFYNRCAEDATRFIVYMTSRQMGKTLEESIADAKDVTLNFNRKGTGGMGNAELRDLFIFVNPAIQALANMVRMVKGFPVKFGAVTAAFVAGGVLMPIINQWLLNLMGDDDDKEAYWNLPPWVRKNNLVFWVPGTKNFVTIPLAQEFRVFYGVGEMISSAVMDHPVNKWGLEIFSSVADLVPINPTGNGGNLMVDFAPTGVQPLMQVGENVDFTGKPIWKENQGNEYAPMYTKAYISTPTWMVKLSEGLNDVTGGNEGKKGAVERNMPFWGDYVNNPAVWNHLLQGYFGGMYNTIAKTFDVGVTAAKGEMPKIYQTPVINRFLNRPVERDNAGVLGEEYYQLTKQRDALMFELRTWKQKSADGDEDAQAHVEEIMDSNEYKRAEVITHYEKILKDLKAGEKAATESADKADIKRSISLYKQQMMEELEALNEGKEPLDAAMEQYDKAKSFSERNKLRMRIEKLMLRQEGADNKKPKARTEDVEKALAYMRGEETESRNVTERYLELAKAEDIRNDARIRAAKARIKDVTGEYRKLLADGKQAEARKFREGNQKYFAADAVIRQQSRIIAMNKKLLGKGSDRSIMRLISNSRNVMLKAIDRIE